MEIAVLGTRGLDLGPASATVVSLWASLITPLDLRCHCIYKTGLGKRGSQRPLPNCSLFLGVLLALPPPLSSTQAYRGGTCRLGRLESLGRASRQGWLVLLPTPGQPALPLPSTLQFLGFRRSPRTPAEYGHLHHAPKGGSGPAQERRIRDLSWDGQSYPTPVGSARATSGHSNRSLAGGGREGGGESGLHRRQRQRREN